jgi:DNA processing protein
VAVVGSRKPSPYGEAVAERLASDLAARGVIIVSGLALGVDAAAHEGALAAGGCTIAVLGTGIDVIYPAGNSELATRIVAEGGALVSQFADGSPPQRGHFPKRNWTLAQLSDLVVVVEASERSGALITAEAALAMDLDVMAVPGSIFSPLSVGCHQLLRDGAGLVQNARDVLAALGRTGEVLDDPLRPPERLHLKPPAGPDAMINHLSDSLPLSAGEVARKLGLPFAEVLGRLTAMELEGAVKRWGDGYVRLTRRRQRP